GLVLVRRPESRGVRGEDFVSQGDAGSRASKLKLCVSYDDAFLARVISGVFINGNAEIAELASIFRVHQLRHMFKRNIFVMASHGLGCRRKDWLRQLLRFAKTAWQLNSTDAAAGVVLFPAVAGEIPAH